MVNNFYKIVFKKPVPSFIIGFFKDGPGRVLGCEDVSLSIDRLTLRLETSQSIYHVIKEIAPCVDVEDIGLIVQKTTFEPDWLKQFETKIVPGRQAP
jgi:hypothetical protein